MRRYKTTLRMAVLATCLAGSPAFADVVVDQLVGIKQFFPQATVVSGPQIVKCTLSGGTETSCFSITLKAEPQAYTPGPWCPTVISDGPDKGGIRIQDGNVHDVDGAFIANLAKLYDDDKWQVFDQSTGEVRVTDSKAACEAAARPDVDPAYNNYCVQCLPDYMPEDATITYTIPLEPQPTWRGHATNATGSGVAYNGVRLDGPAPVDDILAAHTIAPFDDCGGHVNTHVGYHYHAVTDYLEGTEPQEQHAAQIGIAMDGYAIFSRLLANGEAAGDLDRCNGHDAAGLGYHYHAGEAGSNAILGCLSAEAGCTSDDPNGTCDASARRPRP